MNIYIICKRDFFEDPPRLLLAFKNKERAVNKVNSLNQWYNQYKQDLNTEYFIKVISLVD